MDREDAIEYLERKGIIEGKTEYNKREERDIAKAMKQGKLYGDPLVELN